MSRVVWHSNANWSPSGYGNQTAVFTDLLAKSGWDVLVSAYYGLKGHRLNYGNVRVLPGGIDAWGNDVLVEHYNRVKPDIIFSLMDIWVLQDQVLDQIPLAAWTPIDHDPAPKMVIEKLKHVKYPIAMSRFGESQMRDFGLDPFYIPHGVDTEIYCPRDTTGIKKAFNISDDTFFVVVNAANKGYPARKSFDKILKAWGTWIRKHPKSLLYLHTYPLDTMHGMDLLQAADFYRIPPETIRFPDMYFYNLGDYNENTLAEIYSLADVLLSPSMGEGFGICVAEAQLCGCPTIVTDFSAQSEVGTGYKIQINPLDDLWLTPQNSEQAWVRPSAILEGLEWALDHKGDQALRDQTVQDSLRYDSKTVFDRYLLPVFEQIKNDKTNSNRVPGNNVPV